MAVAMSRAFSSRPSLEGGTLHEVRTDNVAHMDALFNAFAVGRWNKDTRLHDEKTRQHDEKTRLQDENTRQKEEKKWNETLYYVHYVTIGYMRTIFQSALGASCQYVSSALLRSKSKP